MKAQVMIHCPHDAIPTKETRIILETIRDNLLIEELKVEYNKLFLVCVTPRAKTKLQTLQ